MVELGIMYFLAFMFAVNGIQIVMLRNEEAKIKVREENIQEILKRINNRRRRVR